MSSQKKILIVDDDDTLRQTLKEQLTLHDEYAVSDVATAIGAGRQTDVVNYDQLDRSAGGSAIEIGRRHTAGIVEPAADPDFHLIPSRCIR